MPNKNTVAQAETEGKGNSGPTEKQDGKAAGRLSPRQAFPSLCPAACPGLGVGPSQGRGKGCALANSKALSGEVAEPQTQPDGRCAGGWVAGAESAEQCLRTEHGAGPGGMQRVSFPYISPASQGWVAAPTGQASL